MLPLNYGSRILDDIWCLIELFEPHCEDRSSLTQIKHMVRDSTTWPKAHALFHEIRKKTLAAEEAGSRAKACQYLFEEICAKTLYNMSRSSAPFDPDSPYWVLPNALYLSRAMGITDAECIRVIIGDRAFPYSHLE